MQTGCPGRQVINSRLIALLCTSLLFVIPSVAGASGAAQPADGVPAFAAAGCGTVLVDPGTGGNSFWAVNLRGVGMSCSSARREARKGGVGAHGYQRYGGWVCSDRQSWGNYRCKKGSQAFLFKLVVR